MLDLDQLLAYAVERGASDVHIKVGSPPYIRIDGRLERIEHASVSPVETERIAFAIMPKQRAEEFLASESLSETQCLILDIFLQGMSGPELIKELSNRRVVVAVIFVTANVDDALRCSLMEEGAVECLFKPFSDKALISALHAAFRVGRLN